MFCDHLEDVELDLHEVYGVDLGDPNIRYGRSYAWLKARIRGLFTTTPVFQPDGTATPATRVARLFWTPPTRQ